MSTLCACDLEIRRYIMESSDPVAAAREARLSAESALAGATGKPLHLWDGNGVHSAPPAPFHGGAILEVTFAVADQSYADWYATEGMARAALALLAVHHGREPDADGLSVDLTARGGLPSRARIVVR